ncbi:MAG: TrkA family potassium uptake protein [Dehalococcoidia bacterium]
MSLRLLVISFTHSRVAIGVAMLSAVVVLGTLGFVVIEGWSLGDSLYMALTTVTTVGYGEVRPLDTEGRLIASFLLLFGVGTAFYILTAMVASIVEGDLQELFGIRRMRVMIEKLSNHHIICGHGRVGEEIARELAARNVPFVIVDMDESAIARARAAGYLVFLGDATTEDTLIAAGITRASAVIAASESDLANTYITLTARGLKPDVFVVARVSSPGLESKLRQAGASRVVSPYSIGGRRMALAALQPMMTDFLDIFSNGSRDERLLAEFMVEEDSALKGRTVADVTAGCRDVVVLAIVDAAQNVAVAPGAARLLSPGDRLTIIGNEDELRRIGAVTRP